MYRRIVGRIMGLSRAQQTNRGAIYRARLKPPAALPPRRAKLRNETPMASPQPRDAIHHPETHGNTLPKGVQGQQNTPRPQTAREQRGPQATRPTRGQPARMGRILAHSEVASLFWLVWRPSSRKGSSQGAFSFRLPSSNVALPIPRGRWILTDHVCRTNYIILCS